jgi:MFS transporter, DHA2 family, multidrug resistance protein
LTSITSDWDLAQVFVPQMLRGVGLMFAIVPITNLALGTLPPERLKNGSGLYNLTRNLGGAVGLATLNTLLDHRMDLHFARLHEAITWSRRPVVEMLNGLAAHIPGPDAQAMALKQFFMMVHQQGVVMAFADVFLVLCLLFAAFAPLVAAMRRPAPDAADVAGH